MNINNKVQEIYKEYGAAIIILRGFDTSEMPKDKRYFSFEIDYFDTVDLGALKEIVVEDIIRNREFKDKYLWMTIEEYQLFKEEESINKMPVILLENDLYDKQYPYRETLSDINYIYKNLYYLEDNELESDQLKVLENVSTFYGQINYSKQSDNYYVTYPEFDKKPKTIRYYNGQEYEYEFVDNYPVNNIFQIELSEDEIPFLDLIKEITSRK